MKRIRQRLANLPKVKVIARLSIGLVASICFISIISARIGYRGELKEGDICQASIYAPFAFSFVDPDATSLKLKEAAARTKAIYSIDPKLNEAALMDINSLYEKKMPVLEGIEPNKFIQNANQMLTSLMSEGLMSEALKEDLLRKEAASIIVRNPQTGVEVEKGVAQILTPNEAKRELASLAQQLFPENRKVRKEAAELVQGVLRPNLVYDEQKTIERRQMAMEKVEPVLREVKKGKLIVEKGEIITADQILQLNELKKRQARGEAFSSISGISILVVIFVGLFAAYLYRYVPRVFFDNQKLILIATVMLFSFLLAKLVTYAPLSEHLVPIISASMLICSPLLITILLSPNVAIMATVMLAVLGGIMGKNTLPPVMMTFVGGLIGTYSVLGVRRRGQLIRAGVLVGLALLACCAGIGLLSKTDPRVYISSGVWGLTCGIVAAFIVTGVLPIFESIFKITTNISLLELSDLNHPLLKQLLMEAPGTYHHSLIVGNLAESACEAVGANSLLARVASYYHDIGKAEKAEYFSENLPKGEQKSKHDKLTPTMSNLIIINHVKKGVELAHKHNLNQAIIDIIREHHGTSQVFFFYQRALERAEDEEEIKKLEFRYPGPKPQTKESAIVLLADSIEAASRILSEPTSASIRGMVHKIINNKFIDGQLEECELTLKNLNSIAYSFVRILTGVFHTRVGYPEAKEPKKKKITK